MSPRAFRTIAATLIVAALASLGAPPRAHALGAAGFRADNAAHRAVPERGFFAFLLQWIAKAGGAMDPNGNS